ncbi:hypothetical protein ACTD5D_21620 [Nocardia takedensis]|uniref:hypothetical protein n=1 Tax=Nocardia takedensis TaxID=259390 RepID=UPI003F76C8B2
MNSFDDAVQRRLRAQQGESDTQDARRQVKSRACAMGAAHMARHLGQLADYLNRHATTDTVEIYPAKKWYKQSTMAPRGHVLKNFRSGSMRFVEVLLPDGQLWEHKELSHVSTPKESGQVRDLQAAFDDPYMYDSGVITIGAFSFTVSIPSGELVATTKNLDGETSRQIDVTEAFATIAANWRQSKR